MRGNRGSQYAINDYKAAGNFPTQGEAYRGCRSQPPAVIRITVARSSNWTATPSRKATTLLELAGARSPGTPIPPKFKGSTGGEVKVFPEGFLFPGGGEESTAARKADRSPKKT